MILANRNEYAVVLDACVLVPMPLCDTLLRLAEEPAMYRPLWSERILKEVGDALQKKLKRTAFQRERRIDAMRAAFPEAEVPIPSEILKTVTGLPDPSDGHVLAAAICGSAQAIVTQNIRHFPEKCLKPYDLVCLTPDEFLVQQWGATPQGMSDKLDAQAMALGREKSSLLQSLKRVAPTFVSLISPNV
jgi:predicted nucleic acid-binding protein